MRAMTVTEFGSPDVLKMQDLPEPEPGPGDLLIAVHATSMNPVDFKIRQNGIGIDRQFPFVLGYDVSGTVARVGEEVEGFQEGDEVYGSPSLARNGANAQYVVMDAELVARKPEGLAHEQAAALPLVTLTAWEALYDRMNIQGHETVLISGGGGGVGHVAIQLARYRGCHVITTASQDASIELAKEMGAAEVINYRTEDVAARIQELTDGKGCPAVFDTIGGASFQPCAQSVAIDGRIALINGIPKDASPNVLFAKNATIHFEFMGVAGIHGIRMEEQCRTLEGAANLIAGERLKPHVSAVHPLEDLPKVHEQQESGHVTGKLVIKVRD